MSSAVRTSAFCLLSCFAIAASMQSANHLGTGDDSEVLVSVVGEKLAEACTEKNCQPPNCYCAGTRPPKGIPLRSTPQFVMLTFDDSVNPNVQRFYNQLFTADRLNPNGCPIRGTFFVTHEWNSYALTEKLYSEGHEIADHSVTHETTKAFKEAGIDRWSKEICGMKKMLEIFGRIPSWDVKGFRAPYLQPGGDLMFEAMARCGVTYDASLPADENSPPMWPHTLDYKSTQNCKIGPCPKNSHPGVWEVPMVYYEDEQNPPAACAMIDACHDNGTKKSAFELLMKNFLRHYTESRAPFPMFMHAGWFTNNPYRWEALTEFIDTALMAFPDTYFVTISDVIEWMKDPEQCEDTLRVGPDGSSRTLACPLERLNDWSCKNKNVQKRQPVCEDPKTCISSRIVYNTTAERRFTTCFECPKSYPWLGNPDGNLFDLMDESIPPADRYLWSPPRGITLRKPKKFVELVKNFNAKDAKARLLQLLKQKLRSRKANPEVLAKILGGQS